MEAVSEGLEKALLAYLLKNPRANLNLKESDFFFPEHRQFYKLLRRGYTSPILMRENTHDEAVLKVLSEIENADPVIDIEPIVKTVTDMAAYREFVSRAHELEESGDFDIEKARKAVLSIRAYSKAKTVKELFDDERIDEMANRKILKTGFPHLDDVYNFEEGQLLIIAGETSKGKTQLAMNIAKKTAEDGGKVLFISLEMNPEQLLSRFVAMTLDYPIRLAYGSNEEYREYAKRFLRTNSWVNNIYIDDSCKDLQAILGDINEVRPDLTVIDYAQLISVDGRMGEEKVVAEIAQTLRTVCHDQRIILISQLSRKTEATDRNPLARLKGSGALEYSASAILYVEVGDDSITSYTLLKNTTGLGYGVGTKVKLSNLNGRYEELGETVS
jgi:replicative DNA helicase